MTTFGWRSRKPSLLQTPCLQPQQLRQGWQLEQRGDFCQHQPKLRVRRTVMWVPASPYLNEKLPAQGVVVLVREDLRELVEGAEALPARGKHRGKSATVPRFLGLSSAHPNDPSKAHSSSKPCCLRLSQGVLDGKEKQAMLLLFPP